MAAILGLSLALGSAGCGGATIVTNPAAKFPVPASDAAPAFLFPVNLTHLNAGGDPLAMGITVTAGVAAHFGKKVISGQQLFDQVGNLSFELAEVIRSQVEAKTFEMGGGGAAIADSLAKTMGDISGKLVELKLLDKPFNFKYIIAIHSHGEEAFGGKMLKVSSWGGIYDAETKQILSYILSTDSYAFDHKPELVMAQLPIVYNKIIDNLLAGAVQ
jgi:hypothetical protein